MARLLLLSLGFAVGLVVGLIWEKPRPVRSVRREVPRNAAAPAKNAHTPAAGPQTAVVETPEDAAPMENLDGYGRIDVDFTGVPGPREVFTKTQTILGAWEVNDHGIGSSSRIAEIDAPPGIAEVWWLRGPRRVGTRVRVVANRKVTLRAADFNGSLVDDRSGVLGVRVLTTWGAPLRGRAVRVESALGGEAQATDHLGCLSLGLRPGRYTVFVGDFQRAVAIVAGEETILEIQPSGQGDLIFDADHVASRRIRLRRTDGRPTRAVSLRGGDNGARQGFVYLAAGEYEVYRRQAPYNGRGIVLARVEVVAGRENRVPIRLAAGKIVVRVEFGPAHAPLGAKPREVVLLRRRGQGGFEFVDKIPLLRKDDDCLHAIADGLPPGTYRVRLLQEEAQPTTVEVGEKAVEITLRAP